jgi:hypothetical protein
VKLTIVEHHLTKASHARQRDTGFQSVGWTEGLGESQLDLLETLSMPSADMTPGGPCTFGFRVLGGDDPKIVLSTLCAVAPFKGDSRSNYYSRNVLLDYGEVERLAFDIPSLLFDAKLFSPLLKNIPEGGMRWQPRTIELARAHPLPKAASICPNEAVLALLIDALLMAAESTPLAVVFPGRSDPMALLALAWPALPTGNRMRLSFRTLLDGRQQRWVWAVSFYDETCATSIRGVGTCLDLRRADGIKQAASEYARRCAAYLWKGLVEPVNQRRAPFSTITGGVSPSAIDAWTQTQQLIEFINEHGLDALAVQKLHAELLPMRERMPSTADLIWRQFEEANWFFDDKASAFFELYAFISTCANRDALIGKLKHALLVWFLREERWRQQESITEFWEKACQCLQSSDATPDWRREMSTVCCEMLNDSLRNGSRWLKGDVALWVARLVLQFLPRLVMESVQVTETVLALCEYRAIADELRYALLDGLLGLEQECGLPHVGRITALAAESNCPSDIRLHCGEWLLMGDPPYSGYKEQWLLQAAAFARDHAQFANRWITIASSRMCQLRETAGVSAASGFWQRLLEHTGSTDCLNPVWLSGLGLRVIKQAAQDLGSEQHGADASTLLVCVLPSILIHDQAALVKADAKTLWLLVGWQDSLDTTSREAVRQALCERATNDELRGWILQLEGAHVSADGLTRLLECTAVDGCEESVALAWLRVLAGLPVERRTNVVLHYLSKLFEHLASDSGSGYPKNHYAEAWDLVGTIVGTGRGGGEQGVLQTAKRILRERTLQADIPNQALAMWYTPEFEALTGLSPFRQYVLADFAWAAIHVSTGAGASSLCLALKPYLGGRLGTQDLRTILAQFPENTSERLSEVLCCLTDVDWVLEDGGIVPVRMWKRLKDDGADKRLLDKIASLIVAEMVALASAANGARLAEWLKHVHAVRQQLALGDATSYQAIAKWVAKTDAVMEKACATVPCAQMWPAVKTGVILFPSDCSSCFLRFIEALAKKETPQFLDDLRRTLNDWLDLVPEAQQGTAVNRLLNLVQQTECREWFATVLVLPAMAQSTLLTRQLEDQEKWIKFACLAQRDRRQAGVRVLWLDQGLQNLQRAIARADITRASAILKLLSPYSGQGEASDALESHWEMFRKACTSFVQQERSPQGRAFMQELLGWLRRTSPALEQRIGALCWQQFGRRQFKSYRLRLETDGAKRRVWLIAAIALPILSGMFLFWLWLMPLWHGDRKKLDEPTLPPRGDKAPPSPLAANNAPSQQVSKAVSESSSKAADMLQAPTNANPDTVPPLSSNAGQNEREWVDYTVKAGDTVEKLAKVHNVTTNEICARNKNIIKAPAHIEVDWVILLPKVRNSADN